MGAAVLLLCAAVPAHATGFRPGDPPALCAGQLFADQIGTDRAERLEAARRPERLWGLGGADVLTGSPTRASCLFGGTDRDRLTLGGGGGAAFGETGADALTGGLLDDVLRGGAGEDTLDGGPGADTLDGGSGRDALAAGAGDDLVDAADGVAEVVDCGAGQDLVAADRLDALIGCESPALAGPAARRAAPDSSNTRVRFTAPARGRYRVLWLQAPCAVPTTALGVLKAGRRTVRLRPPACAGAYRAAIALAPTCRKGQRCLAPPPLQPVARLDFSVRG